MAPRRKNALIVGGRPKQDKSDESSMMKEWPVHDVIACGFDDQKRLLFKVMWVGHAETTWEPLRNVNGNACLDNFIKKLRRDINKNCRDSQLAYAQYEKEMAELTGVVARPSVSSAGKRKVDATSRPPHAAAKDGTPAAKRFRPELSVTPFTDDSDEEDSSSSSSSEDD